MKEQNQTLKRYKEEVVPFLMNEFKYKNVNEVPKLVKIVFKYKFLKFSSKCRQFSQVAPL